MDDMCNCNCGRGEAYWNGHREDCPAAPSAVTKALGLDPRKVANLLEAYGHQQGGMVETLCLNAADIVRANLSAPSVAPAPDARPFDKIGADRLADEVAAMVTRGVLDPRSPAADALLDYRCPPRTPRSDALAAAPASAAPDVAALIARRPKERHGIAFQQAWIDDCIAMLRTLSARAPAGEDAGLCKRLREYAIEVVNGSTLSNIPPLDAAARIEQLSKEWDEEHAAYHNAVKFIDEEHNRAVAAEALAAERGELLRHARKWIAELRVPQDLVQAAFQVRSGGALLERLDAALAPAASEGAR